MKGLSFQVLRSDTRPAPEAPDTYASLRLSSIFNKRSLLIFSKRSS